MRQSGGCIKTEDKEWNNEKRELGCKLIGIEEVIRFAKEKGVLGFGWTTYKNDSDLANGHDKEIRTIEYWDNKVLSLNYGKGVSSAKKAIHNMREGDICWTRDTSNNYYIGKLGKLECFDGASDFWQRDIIITRRFEWFCVGDADVGIPGLVVNLLSRGNTRTILKVKDPLSRVLSLHMYKNLENGSDNKDIIESSIKRIIKEEISDKEDYLELLSSEDLEDVVSFYLQESGWKIIPSTAKPSTKKYEFYMLNKKGQQAAVQVKKGAVLKVEDYKESNLYKVYLFTTKNDGYYGKIPDKVVCLEYKEIENFLKLNRNQLPTRIKTLLDAYDSVAPSA